LPSLPSSLVPRAWQGGDAHPGQAHHLPGRSQHVGLVYCSCCVFIPQESDSATALKVTPEGCDGKLGHGHEKEMLSPQPAAGKDLSTLLPTPPPLTGRAPSGCFSNRIN
ncbi:hypothetical protein N330_09269, partial [Leptosomus discolor]